MIFQYNIGRIEGANSGAEKYFNDRKHIDIKNNFLMSVM